MVESAELIGLLHQIRGAARPLDRLRLATLAWRTLRALGPVERMAVAKALGVEGAERLVEQLGSVRGISPSMLMTAIRKAEEADPEELGRLLHQLRDPETRDEAVAETLESVEEWLVDGSDHVRVVEPVLTGAGSSGPTGIPAPAPEVEVEAETTPISVPPVAEVTAASATALPAPTHVPAPPPPPSSGSPATDPVVTTPRAATRAPRTSASAPGSASPTSPRSAPPTAPPRPARRPARPTTAVATASPSDAPSAVLLERLRGAASDLERLRLLDRCPTEILRLSEAELERVAELFPSGWRRRRALEAMARAGRPTSDLLALLATTFPHPGVTAWVLATLAERDDLDLEAAEVESPSLLRRLRLRQQRRTRR